jgi:hypothetical protein
MQMGSNPTLVSKARSLSSKISQKINLFLTLDLQSLKVKNIKNTDNHKVMRKLISEDSKLKHAWINMI